MDTSEKYIEMCSKATEIQDLKAEGLQNGDIQYRPVYGIVITLTQNWLEDQGDVYANQDATFLCNEYNLIDTVWLPRQDQLQEMIISKLKFCYINPLGKLLSKFNLFINSQDYSICSVNSVEQLWLAFTMKEKFNKIWNEDKKEWEDE